MVMELLEGRDLAAVLKARGPMLVADAVELVLQACEAVAEAHAAGIVHRDLKPANLFLTKGADGGPCVKVIDFGISKHASAELALTTPEEAIGSPLYMSPEQIRRSSAVDARSDVWSLGVLLYELVAGVTPFHAEGIMELCTKVGFEPPTPLSAYRPDAPAGFEAVLLQALEKDRERRLPHVAAFAAALAPYTSARAALYAERVAAVLGEAIVPARATDVLPPEVAAPAPAASNAATGAAVVRSTNAATAPSRRATLVAAVAVVMVISAMAVAAGFWWRARPGPTMLAAPGSAEVAPVASSAVPPATLTATVTATATVEPPPVAAPSAMAPASTARSKPAAPAKPAATTPKAPAPAAPQPRKDPYAQ
jgi:serine/threonine-protein kinase